MPQLLPGLPWGPEISVLHHGSSWFIWESQWITPAGEPVQGQSLALFWTLPVPQPSLRGELVTQSQLPSDREQVHTFLCLKGKWREGGGFDFFLTMEFWHIASFMFHYFSPSRENGNVTILGMESIQPPIPLCHCQAHAYHQEKAQEWLNNQAALWGSLLCKGGIICPEVELLLQGFQEQPKLVRLVPLVLRGQQSGVGYTVLDLDRIEFIRPKHLFLHVVSLCSSLNTAKRRVPFNSIHLG